MKKYILHDLFGRIAQQGTCPDDAIGFQEHSGLLLMECDASDDLNYVLDGIICKYTKNEIAAKNNLASGWKWQMPERIAVDTRTLSQAQQYTWDKIKIARGVAEISPFLFQETLYDANTTNISGAAQMALIAQGMSQPFSIKWTTYSNLVVTLDGFEMISLGTTLGFRNSQIYDIARMLRIEIEAATTNEQVDSITWPS